MFTVIGCLHQGIHAEIYRKLLSIHGPSKLTKLNFPSMFNLYAEYKMKEGFSHEYMANYYVNIMASALKKYDNNKFDIDTYKAYAWEGLEGTDFYQKYYNSLTLSQKTEMENKKKQLLANRSKLDCNDK